MAPEVTEPTKEECLLACVAHLALFGGFWLLGPLALYYWKHKESRFIAFHAVQAILLSLVMLAFGILGMLVLFVLVLGLAAAAHAAFGKGAAGPAVMLGYALGLLIMALPAILAIVGGVRAFRGQWWSMPIIGGLAKTWLDKNEPPALDAPPR
jgi:uncharacterized membrane protein